MNVRLRMNRNCYSNLGATCEKVEHGNVISTSNVILGLQREFSK